MVLKKFGKECEKMTFESFFSKMKTILSGTDISGVQGDFAFQFDITGPGAGTFYVEKKGDKLSIEPYDYHDRDALILCSSETLEKIVTGKLDPVAAFALRKIKIEGNLDKVLVIKPN